MSFLRSGLIPFLTLIVVMIVVVGVIILSRAVRRKNPNPLISKNLTYMKKGLIIQEGILQKRYQAQQSFFNFSLLYLCKRKSKLS